MKMHDFYTLFVASLITTCVLMVVTGCAPRQQDYWGSLSKGVEHVENRP